MKKDRENSIEIYNEAFEKTNSPIAKENLDKAKNEIEPIELFLKELEAEMPKKLSYDETKKLVEETLNKFNEKPNKGMIMKLFKSNINVDMAIASKIINEILN